MFVGAVPLYFKAYDDNFALIGHINITCTHVLTHTCMYSTYVTLHVYKYIIYTYLHNKVTNIFTASGSCKMLYFYCLLQDNYSSCVFIVPIIRFL